MTSEAETCHHMMLERVKETKVVEMNGHGVLTANFRCSTCHMYFYSIGPSPKPKHTEDVVTAEIEVPSVVIDG